ncbi:MULTISPECIES: YybH family protein [unclassified Saccharothrix]|uniref:YybH family protein n=1 Tax=unclassified Saccharothrix TaxID=2593673 RepID=UPI00307F60B8
MSTALRIDPDFPDLTDDIDTQNDIFIDVFNSGDGALFDRLYRPDAISNFSGGQLTGAPRKAWFEQFLSAKPYLEAKLTHAYVAGDVSLIGVTFQIDTTDEEGRKVRITGSCTDVLRRGEDGRWLMAVDRPVMNPPQLLD